MTRLERTVERRDYAMALKRTSWGAVFGGAFIAVAIMTLLGTLGVAIGAATIDPATGDTPSAQAFGIGAGLWWLGSGILSLFAGGWVAGRLAGLRRKGEGTLHGVLTWALTTVATIALMTTVVGALVSGAMRVIGTAASAVGQGVQAVAGQVADANVNVDAPNVAWDSAWQEAQQLLEQTGDPALQPEALEQDLQAAGRELSNADVQAALSDLHRAARSVATEADQEALVNVLVARTDLDRAEAQRRVQTWTNTFQNAWQQTQQVATSAAQQARSTAAQAAQASVDAVSTAAWWTFIYLLITAIAAGAGGLVGAPRGERRREVEREPEPVV